MMPRQLFRLLGSPFFGSTWGKRAGRVAGAKWDNVGKVFHTSHFISSFYADDGAFLFASRAELERFVPILHAHFQRLGLLMHVGTAAKASKTECMYYPPHHRDTITADDVAPIKTDDAGGFVSFTEASSTSARASTAT